MEGWKTGGNCENGVGGRGMRGDEGEKELRLLGLESLEPEFKGDPQLSRRFCSLKRPHQLEAGAMHGFYAGIRSVSLSKRITSLRRN